MKFTLSSLLTLLATTITTKAYTLRVHFQDGLEIRVTGDYSTPCQDFPPIVKGNKVSRIAFDSGEYTSEFYVWSKINCGGELVQNHGHGNWDVEPNAEVGSLKVM